MPAQRSRRLQGSRPETGERRPARHPGRAPGGGSARGPRSRPPCRSRQDAPGHRHRGRPGARGPGRIHPSKSTRADQRARFRRRRVRWAIGCRRIGRSAPASRPPSPRRESEPGWFEGVCASVRLEHIAEAASRRSVGAKRSRVRWNQTQLDRLARMRSREGTRMSRARPTLDMAQMIM